MEQTHCHPLEYDWRAVEQGPFFYVYYTKQEGRWTIVAVHPEGDKRPYPYTARTITQAVDELGAFQKVNTWLQKSNAALAEQEAW